MTKIEKSGIVANRLASDVYTIHLDNEQCILTSDVLIANTANNVIKSKEMFYATLKFMSFTTGVLQLKATYGHQFFIISILPEKDRLKVSCTCGKQEEKLCIHVYRAFKRIFGIFKRASFTQFQPGGVIEIAWRHKHYFSIQEPYHDGLYVRSKPGLGHVFKVDNNVQPVVIQEILTFPARVRPIPKVLTGHALTYVLIVSFKNALLPFLLPCMGILNKDGFGIKGMMKFLTGTQKEYDTFLTDEQRDLNKSCFNLWKHVEKLPGQINESLVRVEDKEGVWAVYDIWQSMIPLLRKQRFLLRYHIYGQKELTKVPHKRRFREISISDLHPALRFRIIKMHDFYRLELKISVNGRDMKNYQKDHPFFITVTNVLFFWSCVRDAAIIEWMTHAKGRITIFKEHFHEFENTVINRLRQYYNVEFE